MKRANNPALFLLALILALTASAAYADTTAVAPAPADSALKMSGLYLGFGAGLSVGNVPVFATWRKALPGTMPDLGVTPQFETSADDMASLQYSVTEAPDEFNFALPFSISLHNIKAGSATSLALSFFHSSKQFQSVFSFANDTLRRRVSLHETLSYYSLSIEASYSKAIPPVFFSIDGVQQTYLTMSLGVSPLNTFTRKSGVKNETPRDDPRMQALAAHVDSVQREQVPSSANGMSVSWRLGISALRNYGQGGGLEMGLYYGGAYTSYFYSGGERVNTGQINPDDDNADKPMSFLSNRIELKFTFLKSPSREKQVSQ